MLSYLLLLCYIFLFSYILYKWKWLDKFYFTNQQRVSLFLLKVFFGIAYQYLHTTLYGLGDSIRFMNDANYIYDLLFTNPIDYFKLILYPCGDVVPTEFIPHVKCMMLWSDEGSYFIVRMLAVFNVFSFKEIYINIVFYNAIILFGFFAMAEFFNHFFPEKKHLITFSLFALPCISFWTSGLHKDGFIFSCLGLFLYSLSNLIQKKQLIANFITILIASYLLLIVRGYEIIILLPGLVALYWCHIQPKFAFVKFSIVYIISFILFFKIDTILHMGFTNFILQKQYLFKYFCSIGKTSMPLIPITHSGLSFLKTMPQALYRAICLPNIFDAFSKIEFQYAYLHSTYLAFIIVLFITNYKKYLAPIHPVLWFCLFYSISLFAFIGWLVPNVGALTRYTSVAFPFFTIFFVLNADMPNYMKKFL